MKTKLFKTILALALALIALPMMGQDFIEVFFKDGTTRKFYLKNITEISTSRQDAQGVMHSNYDFQHVTTNNGKYVYALSDVDSISFSKFNIEKARENFNSSIESVIQTLVESKSIRDLDNYLSDLKSLECIKDAWIESNDLYVKVADFETISFHNCSGIISNSPSSNVRNVEQPEVDVFVKKNTSLNNNKSKLSAVLINQTENDERQSVKDARERLHRLEEKFNEYGIKTFYNDHPTIDFFYSDLFKYDIIVLISHGGYNNKVHSFMTAEELGRVREYWVDNVSEVLQDWNFDDYYDKICKLRDKYNATDKEIWMSWVEEKRNNKTYRIAYPDINESFFSLTSNDGFSVSTERFQNPYSVLFSLSCHSLEGDDVIIGNNKYSPSLANKFHSRGLGLYLGYDAEVSFDTASPASTYFIEGLLKGRSFNNVLINYPIDYLIDKYSVGAVLHALPNSDLKEDVFDNLFLLQTYTAPSNNQSVNEEYVKNKYVTVSGVMATIDKDAINKGVIYGTDINNLSKKNDADIVMKTISDKGNYLFMSKLIDLEPGNAYYYCAYTFDGQNFNYGDTCSFYLEKFKDLELSKGSFCIDESESTTIDITGNGEYDIYNGNEKVTKVTLEGEKLIIEAIGAGESTIIVTDKKTGKTVPLEVTVWAKLSVAIIGNIDLEVGASADVRIISGNGDYKLESSNPNVATPTLVGEFVKVDALSAGTATITVTDNKTGQTESFTVTIAESAPIDIPAEPINLGLPSGTLWASWNVGATAPEEYGNYYSWGETEVRDQYYFTTYSLCDGTVSSCHDIGADISGTQYDVAHVKWGGGWCMPSKDDFMELVYNCEYKETNQNGVKGLQFTGKNGNYIFLPYTGYYWNTENSKVGSEGSYWSSTLTTSRNHAHEMNFSKGEMLWDCYINRFAGLSVRPVKHSTPPYDNLVLSTYDPITMNVNAGATFMILSSSGSYEVESSNKTVASVKLRDNFVDVLGEAAGTATITVRDTKSGEKKTIEVTITDNTPSQGTHAEAVDLGLPSGTKWADRNVGASSPEDYGGLYSLAMTDEVETCGSYKWGYGEYGEITKYCTSSKYGTVDNKTVLDPEDDVACVTWGGQWRMPTLEQAKELVANCDSEWTTLNGVWGRQYTSKINGKSIFIPAAGYYAYGTYYSKGTNGFYWTSTLNDKNSERAYDLFLASGSTGTSANFRYYGAGVRPVKK